MVDAQTANRVARQEKQAYEGHLEGYYGADEVERAKRLGLNWIAWSTLESARTLSKKDIITGIEVIQPITRGYRFVPIYASDLDNPHGVAAKLKSAKIKTEEWKERTPEGELGRFRERTLLCVSVDDVKTAAQLIEWMHLTHITSFLEWMNVTSGRVAMDK